MNRAKLAALACVAVLALGIIASATSIPSWLDDGISKYNAKNPSSPIRFVQIKDQFVWYDMAKASDVPLAQIRERIKQIVLDNGYAPMDDEELVTTGRPPVESGASAAKKCWSRSFVLNIAAQGNTKAVGAESPGQRQRMLTNLVCEDTATWWTAFRTLD